MIVTSVAATDRRSPGSGEALIMRARQRLAALGASLVSPERWVLLSSCDWYPDASGYPVSHATLLARDDTEG